MLSTALKMRECHAVKWVPEAVSLDFIHYSRLYCPEHSTSRIRQAMRLSQRFAAWLASKSFSLHVAFVLAVASAVAAQADTEQIVVMVDQARIVKIPASAQTLVIGNPQIADVTLQNGVMIVTGKGFGETNFIALDSVGNPVAESMIRVIGDNNALVVQRGMDRQSYSCAPSCEPTVKLGDDAKYFGEVSGQVQTHTSQSAGR